MTTVLVSGADGPWGAAVLRRLAARPATRALALDTSLRGQQVAELLRDEQVEMVLQLGLHGELERVDAEEAKQANVLRTMELLGACLRAETPRVIVRSTTLVHGPHIKNPAFLDERRPASARLKTPWLRDLAEIEGMAAAFAARHARPRLTVLRFAPVVGGGLRSAFGDYLLREGARGAQGFDPRVQLLHGDDALAATEHALATPIAGVVHVGADPPLPLSRALRLLGDTPPATLDGVLRAARAATRPIELHLDQDFLRYSCVADTARMRGEWGFTPRYDSVAALKAIVRARETIEGTGEHDTRALPSPASAGEHATQPKVHP